MRKNKGAIVLDENVTISGNYECFLLIPKNRYSVSEPLLLPLPWDHP